MQGFSETGDAIQGFTHGRGKSGVWGHNERETGLCFGVTGSSMSRQGAGVLGQLGPANEPVTALGGNQSASAGVMGVNAEGSGVIGHSISGAGAMGVSDNFHGVVGTASNKYRCGVFGINASGVGVGAKSVDGIGMMGVSKLGHGIAGITTGQDYTAGVLGISWGPKNTGGVAGVATRGIGVYGQGEQYAGYFEGNVMITGNCVIQKAGAKNGVVTLKDGSRRLVCAIESPEAWFEDFGEARLVKGTAHVPLDPDFAQAVDTASYHVFITPYGDCGGLYVSNRTGKGFDVTERGVGHSEVAFSWRIVARPKGAEKGRFPPAPGIPDSRELFTAFQGKSRKGPDLSAFEKMDTGLPSLKLLKLPKLSPPKRRTFGKMKLPKLPKISRTRPRKGEAAALAQALLGPEERRGTTKTKGRGRQKTAS